MGNISNLTVLSGGSDGNDALSRLAGSVPSLMLQVLETAKAGGLDLAALLAGDSPKASSNGTKAVIAVPPK
jgi:hypothetical protein